MMSNELRIVCTCDVREIEDVMNLLKQTYWANNRVQDVMVKAMQNSDNIYVYNGDALIGYARLVTDKATFFWICDVIVDEHFRGQGIGKKIIDFIKQLEYYDQSKGLLLTKDAHSLYEKIGFDLETEKAMVKDRKENVK